MIYNIYRIKVNIIKKEDKKELVRLLKMYKKHIWDDCDPDSNNLPYELALLDIQEMVEYLIKEIKSELK